MAHVVPQLVCRRAPHGRGLSTRPRIVIADDRALLLEAMIILLAPAGDVGGTARDGASLHALVDSANPDVIITDRSMQKRLDVRSIGEMVELLRLSVVM
jgi:DNA-binding NarL/FixJ family response regulator